MAKVRADIQNETDEGEITGTMASEEAEQNQRECAGSASPMETAGEGGNVRVVFEVVNVEEVIGDDDSCSASDSASDDESNDGEERVKQLEEHQVQENDHVMQDQEQRHDHDDEVDLQVLEVETVIVETVDANVVMIKNPATTLVSNVSVAANVHEAIADMAATVSNDDLASGSAVVADPIEVEPGPGVNDPVVKRETVPWAPMWNKASNSDDYVGWVASLMQAEKVKRVFESHMAVRFVSDRKRANFGVDLSDPNTNLTLSDKFRLRYTHRFIQSDLVPFVVTSFYELMCEYGKDRHESLKRKRQEEIERERQLEIVPQIKRRKRPTKTKLGCPAKVYMKEVLRFPDFKVDKDIEYRKSANKKLLRKAVGRGDTVTCERRIYIQLPKPEDHLNTHPVTQAFEAKYEVRKAEQADCMEIIKLFKELAKSDTVPDKMVMTPEKLKEDAFCEHPSINLVVAVSRQSKEVVAVGTFYFHSTWRGKITHLDEVHVNAEHRGQGIGLALMQAVAICANDQKCVRMNWTFLCQEECPKLLYPLLRGESVTEKEGRENVSISKEQLQRFTNSRHNKPKKKVKHAMVFINV